MSKKDIVQRELCKSLGGEYRITCIDHEPVIYRDFGNGFNVVVHIPQEKISQQQFICGMEIEFLIA